MTDLISYPFRFAGSGKVAVVEQGSDEAAAEQIAALILTRTSERDLCPDFGITDPTGHGLDGADLEAAVTTFGPDVDITSVEITDVTETTQQVRVEFT